MIWQKILLILHLWSCTDAFKILVLYITPSYSHQRAIIPLTERLVKEGHELVVISPNAVPGLNHANYTFVDLSFAYNYISDGKRSDAAEGTINIQQRFSKWELVPVFKQMTNFTKKLMSSEPVLNLIQRVTSERTKFDLIITESTYIPFACGLARVFAGSPRIISMMTAAYDPHAEVGLGSIFHPSFVPSFFSDNTARMSLWQKLDNWVTEYYIMPEFSVPMERIAREFFVELYGSGSDRLVDGCWGNVSLSLVASNSLYFYPRLLGPNVIEIGPLHLKTPEKLPKDLQAWLDGATKGVIYFSLGSNMKSKSLPEEVRANFLKFFKELPSGYRVLWKWELDGEIPGQSENILARKWLPQDSVLAHPKVKVFITQGGLQSFQETVHYGVPTIGIPWFGDQECNVAKMVDAGIGVKLLPQDLSTYKKVKSAIESVLFDERYSKNMQRLSTVSHDFTARGMDTAVFWVEHVTKFGAEHLRPSTADTTLFEFFCLDILTVILVISLIVLYVLISIVKCFFAVIFSSKNTKIKKS